MTSFGVMPRELSGSLSQLLNIHGRNPYHDPYQDEDCDDGLLGLRPEQLDQRVQDEISQVGKAAFDTGFPIGYQTATKPAVDKGTQPDSGPRSWGSHRLCRKQPVDEVVTRQSSFSSSELVQRRDPSRVPVPAATDRCIKQLIKPKIESNVQGPRSQLSFVATWVESKQGQCWGILDTGCDKPGLYAIIFKQWEYHGSGFPPDDAKQLPWIRDSGRMDWAQLVRLTRALMDTYHAVAFVVWEDADQHQKLVHLFQEDIRGIGWNGKVVPGLPNSAKAGIQRGSGIARGQGPCFIKSMPQLHRLWDAACEVIGRPLVFNSDVVFPAPNESSGSASAPAANFITPPDGVLWTTHSHAFVGLDRHRDWEGDSCGSLQGLAYVFPPPREAQRCGTAFCFYSPHPELCKRIEVLALSAWSSSPDCDYRTSPMPSLGSPKIPSKGWNVIGGPFGSKADVMAMSNPARHEALSKLPDHVRQLLPSTVDLYSTHNVPSSTEWLIKCGFEPLEGQAIKKAFKALQKPEYKRRLFLQALAGGLQPGTVFARMYWAYGQGGIIATGCACLKNSILFNDPGKLHRWVAAGGAHCTLGQVVLQPSGRIGAKRKSIGNLKSTKATNTRARLRK